MVGLTSTCRFITQLRGLACSFPPLCPFKSALFYRTISSLIATSLGARWLVHLRPYTRSKSALFYRTTSSLIANRGTPWYAGDLFALLFLTWLGFSFTLDHLRIETIGED